MKKQMILAMMASVAILAACSDDDNGSGNPGPGPAPSGVYEKIGRASCRERV